MRRINAGETVVDIGCGAGTDLLLAAGQTGPAGRAIGVDMTPSMLDCARDAAERAHLPQVELRLGDATSLPDFTTTVHPPAGGYRIAHFSAALHRAICRATACGFPASRPAIIRRWVKSSQIPALRPYISRAALHPSRRWAVDNRLSEATRAYASPRSMYVSAKNLRKSALVGSMAVPSIQPRVRELASSRGQGRAQG